LICHYWPLICKAPTTLKRILKSSSSSFQALGQRVLNAARYQFTFNISIAEVIIHPSSRNPEDVLLPPFHVRILQSFSKVSKTLRDMKKISMKLE
jgi:hypothetical protein